VKLKLALVSLVGFAGIELITGDGGPVARGFTDNSCLPSNGGVVLETTRVGASTDGRLGLSP
jgi:hypothetical protein